MGLTVCLHLDLVSYSLHYTPYVKTFLRGHFSQNLLFFMPTNKIKFREFKNNLNSDILTMFLFLILELNPFIFDNIL